MEKTTKSKASLKQVNNSFSLYFFNSKEVYDIKFFDTKRKALNYAKKYNVLIEEKELSQQKADYLFSL